ncbi:hypothetical protein [Stenotrophomonas pavanii]|nr:hypothetical protein [Stenotrophomonas pavanii]NGM56506.1 hypothetical protein [Stenotrophomonas pavanii]
MNKELCWQMYVDWGQRDRAIWWLMNVPKFTRRAAESLVANYENKQRAAA